MIKEDYRKYLSYDSGKGYLLSYYDVEVLNRHGIAYQECSNLKELIFLVEKYLDWNCEEELDELEEVLGHLNEMHYYYEVNK